MHRGTGSDLCRWGSRARNDCFKALMAGTNRKLSSTVGHAAAFIVNSTHLPYFAQLLLMLMLIERCYYCWRFTRKKSYLVFNSNQPKWSAWLSKDCVKILSLHYTVFGRPYYRSCLWHDVSSVCLSVCRLSSVCRLWRFLLWQNGTS